jgi:aspartate carbamoyltransferase catalytic subunit
LDSLADLSAEEVRALAAYACGSGATERRLCGRVVAVLPLGPTALAPPAWIAAASRLGAGVLRRDDFDAAESDDFDLCAEAARWADVLVVSHSTTGFARAAAEATGRPVVNAGEPGGEDPGAGISLIASALHGGPPLDATRPLRAAVCGDLAGSRSARAFLSALAALDATVLLVPAQSRDLPDIEVERLARRMRRHPFRFEARSMSSLLDMVDTVLLAREETPQLPLFREVGMPPGEAERRARREVEDLDVLFVAGGAGRDRLIHEPFRGRRRTALPAGAEHPTAIRALEAALLFAAGEIVADPRPPAEVPARYRSGLGILCRGERCIGARRPDRVTPDFLFGSRARSSLECRYCGEHATARFAASKIEGRFHPIDSPYARHILDANLVLFASDAEALAAGFEPARRGRETEAANDPDAGTEA